MSRLALYLLGPPRLDLDGEPIHVPRRKAMALIAYLAVTRTSHSRDSLATFLWPEHDQSSARAELSRTLSVINKTLGEGWLTVDRETAGLNQAAAPPTWLDVDRFRELLAACEAHGHAPAEICPTCLPLLEEALALHGDGFMAGFTLRDSVAFDEWQFFETEGLRNELAGALERLAQWYGAKGECEPAIAYARRWLELDPLHEPAHRHLMRLYAQAGRRSAALRQYRTCLRALEQELAVPPSDETTALYQRIRAERSRPAAPTTPPSIQPLSSAADGTLPLPAIVQEAGPIETEREAFVARARELAQLGHHLEAALAGRGQVALVVGQAGSGKTTLLHEFARRAQEAWPDLVVAGGSCNAHTGPGDPYLPFREMLGLLTGDVEAGWSRGTITQEGGRRLWALLPTAIRAVLDVGQDLIDTLIPGAALTVRAASLESPQADWLGRLERIRERQARRSAAPGATQGELFEQVANVLKSLSEQPPLLLMVDDAQWADVASINLLFHLGRRLGESRILIVVAYRPEDVALGRDGERHPLEPVISELARIFGEIQVDLDEATGHGFVEALLDSEPNQLGPTFREALCRRTGGHALFTVELLRAMQERGDVLRDDAGRWVEGAALDWETLPARVEAVIAERVARLEEESRDILDVASVEGETFTGQVVARAQGFPERGVLRALSQELDRRHRLVREEGELQVEAQFLSRYRFAHALFQHYLYGALSDGERRLLHGEVALALEELYGERSLEIAVQLAHHYTRAGRTEKAVEYTLRAGERARLAYANEEAIAHYRRALALLDGTLPGGSRWDWRLAALSGLGQVYLGTGEAVEGEKCLREAIAIGRETGLAPRALARLHYWLGEVLYWQGRGEEMLRVGQEGMAHLCGDDESTEAVLMYDSVAAGHLTVGNRHENREYARKVARLLPRLPYSEELRSSYVLVFADCHTDKDPESAMKWLDRLEERALAHHDLRAQATVHSGSGILLDRRGDWSQALVRYRQAMDLFTRIGDLKHANELLIEMGRIALQRGNLGRAEASLRRALETAQALGIRFEMARAHGFLGLICLCRDDLQGAEDAFLRTIELARDGWNRGAVAWGHYGLGRVRLAQGKRALALERFQQARAAALTTHGVPRGYLFLFAGTLNVAEEADQRIAPDPSLMARGEPRDLIDEFLSHAPSALAWQDALGDCSFNVQDDGLEIHAANGRDLWYLSLSAPRVLRETSGDLAAQTVCAPVSEDKPAIGGLLLWKDKKNYVRLDRGTFGARDVSLTGCLDNEDLVIGCVKLPLDASGRVYLRLERAGGCVRVLCSADGEAWFGVGEAAFPAEDPVQVGLHAIGKIDRTNYHGAYPEGTAIRFESFQLWEV